MKFTTYIAKRFLLGGKGSSTSKFTGWVAIIGMAVGSFSLVLSIAVLNGFEQRVNDKIRGLEGDLRLTGDRDFLIDCEAYIKSTYLDVQTMSFIERNGLIQGSSNESRLVTFKAVDVEKITSFYQLNLESNLLQTDNPPVIIGRLVADRLNLQIGDNIMLVNPVDQLSSFSLPRRIKGVVAGVFQANVLDYDDRLVFIPFDVGKSLFGHHHKIGGIDLRCKDESMIPEIQHNLNNKYNLMTLTTWDKIHESLFQAMKMERIGAIAVLSMIILVASFNLTSTLVLITVQKIRQIGILRTIGATSADIRSIIVKQGLMVGGIGMLVGITLSGIIILTQYYYDILPLPEDIYFMDTLPMILTFQDIIIVPIITILVISLSSWLAAKRAIMIQPKDAVHINK